MQSTSSISAASKHNDRQTRLAHAIEHAAHLLPAQGPIKVFIHHNTLHAFEDLPFDEAVQKGSRVFGGEPYLSCDRYRQELVRGRIRVQDLAAVLEEGLGERGNEKVLSQVSRHALRLAMLEHPLRAAPDAELRWFIAETDALRKVRPEVTPEKRQRLIAVTRRWTMRDVRKNGNSSLTEDQRSKLHELLRALLQQSGEAQMENWDVAAWEAFSLGALWRICSDGVKDLPSWDLPEVPPVRHRDLLQQATGQDADLLVHEVLIRYCAAFLDQGFAHWQLPGRDQGFLQAFRQVYEKLGGPADLWQRGLVDELRRIGEKGTSPLDSILQSLQALGVQEPEWDEFLSSTLLALRGWGGMIQQIEIRGDRVAHPVPRGSLVEFLAVRLLLDRLAAAHVARSSLGLDIPLDKLRVALRQKCQPASAPSTPQRAFLVFQLAQLLDWLPEDLFRLNREEWAALLKEIESFSDLERRRIFHRAYERRFTRQTLDAISIHSVRSTDRIENPRYQVMCCLDEREESFRRHLEELAPDVETFGAAGFFNVAMYYLGAADAHFTPLCPFVLQPKHWVSESVQGTQQDLHRRRTNARRALGTATHQIHVGSRGMYGGALLTAGFGVLAAVPLVARTLFPRVAARVRRGLGRFVRPPHLTQLQLERSAGTPGPEPGHVGFSVEEMAGIGERLLRDVGLTSGFARLVIVLGHGSISLNNPHESAHDCGACGGNVGGPNARALAQILNDSRIREILQEHGVKIPADTVFVGGLHNTCNEEVTLLDVDFVPPSHRDELAAAKKLLEETCDRNAHERCRRFHSAPLSIAPSAARRHVEERSEDLSQVRPEWGHATNAICIVGRRSRTQGLFLDRRAFLVSYDPLQDEQGAVLARLLGAAFPVCGGINLEYYFSYTDSTGWGSGTKLPHNITSLLGVMDGAASDMRTGLPWQMVEIHEPVRLLFVIETTPERMLQMRQQNETIDRLCRNEWVQLALLDPHSNQIQVFRQGQFMPYEPEVHELKQVKKSVDWYRGWRDHLEFAQIVPAPHGRGGT
ncbi:MAG: DUF2309 domain-containing protein [Pirellulaceae bacterium]